MPKIIFSYTMIQPAVQYFHNSNHWNSLIKTEMMLHVRYVILKTLANTLDCKVECETRGSPTIVCNEAVGIDCQSK